MKNRKKIWIIMLLTSSLSIWNVVYLPSYYYVPFQNAFGLTNTQMGSLLSIYGVLALFGYFFGGAFADRFEPKKLIVLSNYMTAALGFYTATFPGYRMLLFVYLMYGITSPLLHWAAFIKSIRMMGDDEEQGKIFGWFQCFYGLLSIIMAYLVLMAFSGFIANNGHFEYIIITYSAVSLFTGTLVALLYKPQKWAVYNLSKNKSSFNIKQLGQAFRLPITWINCIIILCIYFIVSGVSYLNPYLNTVYLVPVTWATAVGITVKYFFRIVCSPVGGIMIDKLKGSYKLMLISAALVIISGVGLILVPKDAAFLLAALIVGFVLCAAANLPRSCLHTPLSEGKVPLHILGTVSGIAAAVGYSTDVWVFTFWGNLIDRYGNQGYTYVFLTLVACAIIMVVVALLYKRYLMHLYAQEQSVLSEQ